MDRSEWVVCVQIGILVQSEVLVYAQSGVLVCAQSGVLVFAQSGVLLNSCNIAVAILSIDCLRSAKGTA